MTEQPEDPKFDNRQAPTLAYIKRPDIGCYTDLRAARKTQNLSDLGKLNANIGVVKSSEQRVMEREESILRLVQDEKEKQTRSGLLQKRREEMHNQNTGKFGEQTIGIHGQELPKYNAQTESKQWWKHYQQSKNPKHSS